MSPELLTLPYDGSIVTIENRREKLYNYAMALQDRTDIDSLEKFALLVEYGASFYDFDSPVEVDSFMRDMNAMIMGYQVLRATLIEA